MHKIVSFVLAQTPKSQKTGSASAVQATKSAPHYFASSVPSQYILNQEKIERNGKQIHTLVKFYKPEIALVEVSAEVENIFHDATHALKEQLVGICYELVEKYGGKLEPSEVYTVYIVSGYEGDPNQFFKHSEIITSLLKSEKITLDSQEIEYTLSYQLKYAKNDLVIVDWDGAFVFDTDGEVGEVLELFELANYQLLQYRVLDKDLDHRLQKIADVIKKPSPKWRLFKTREIDKSFREVITLRAQSISEFETLERDIKLIGDWYSARLYDLLTKKFRLDEWRKALKEKLESLEDVYTIASENLGMSRMQFLEYVQIVGFFVLQIGWFVLIVLEFLYFTGKPEV